MLDYDAEAACYDATRGGEERAAAAADAIDGLLTARTDVVVEIAGGTGSIGAQLTLRGRTVAVSDLSLGMVRLAAQRLPGQAIQAEAGRLPLADASVDAVTSIWLLHLLPTAEAVQDVLAEVARVLRPGGRYVTTVDKAAARAAHGGRPVLDHRPDVGAALAQLGLDEAGSAEFVGGTPDADGTQPRYTLVAYTQDHTRDRAGD